MMIMIVAMITDNGYNYISNDNISDTNNYISNDNNNDDIDNVDSNNELIR